MAEGESVSPCWCTNIRLTVDMLEAVPTKDRGVGGYDLMLTAGGLWVASDTTHIGREVHERLAFLPLP